MRHYRAKINQCGTTITLGIFDAEDRSAANALFDRLVWWNASVIEISEVDPVEVARVRNLIVVPAQMALPGL